MTETPGLSGARMLLRRLRNAMARGGAAQARLDQTVKLIAGEMVAEVCSIYLLRAGEVLELFATEGLKKEAVHKTRLRVGEGLVGDIASHARPLALADAQHHPQFAYRPETGEEMFQSLMGVPILRAGRVVGVLVIQNRTRRQYSEEEIETLETVAMVLAELVAGGELVSAEELRPGDGIALLPLRLDGVTLCPGLARGVAVLHQATLQLQQLVAEDPEREAGRLAGALKDMQSAIDEMMNAGDLAAHGEHFEVLEAYRLFAQDQGWRNRMMEAVQSGLTAEAAVQKVQNDTRARMREVTDLYLRERLADLDDLANRLLRHLLGADVPTLRRLPEEAIVVARTMGPADLLDYDRQRLKGVVLEEGSQNAHVAIVARALDIPVLGRCQGLMQKVGEGDPLVIDGDNETLLIRPSDDILQAFADSMRQRLVKREAYQAIRDLPAVTLDGVTVDLNINAGLLMDVPQLSATGAAGIGLYRTEIPFMVSHEYPDVARQTEIYAKVLDGAGDRTVIFRTLDIGSDKVLPYWNRAPEENPAMGWRAVRIALDRPAMLRQQLRAMLSAAAGRTLSVMFPMVTEMAEFESCRRLLDLELERQARRGIPAPSALRIGAMVEVPALLWQLPELLPRVDFLSVGSNDLQQFLFAADRDNPAAAGRYDTLAPAMRRALSAVAQAAADAGRPLGLCGEMAGDPLAAMALLCLGYRALSMAPPRVLPMRAAIRSLDFKGLEAYWQTVHHLDGPALRSALLDYAVDHKIPL
ncbi:MAG TPA: phosphoenolpyruvate--protein phosphotransferase [Dongiaceae bacterium]|nr:phosphoenolpyruvate--protein phosphotransferase [Dongiaceae bacterium]